MTWIQYVYTHWSFHCEVQIVRECTHWDRSESRDPHFELKTVAEDFVLNPPQVSFCRFCCLCHLCKLYRHFGVHLGYS